MAPSIISGQRQWLGGRARERETERQKEGGRERGREREGGERGRDVCVFVCVRFQIVSHRHDYAHTHTHTHTATVQYTALRTPQCKVEASVGRRKSLSILAKHLPTNRMNRQTYAKLKPQVLKFCSCSESISDKLLIQPVS